MEASDNFLEIKDLSIHFFSYKSVVRVVEGLHLAMHKGETLGIVGESGCGKSVTALAIMRLIPYPPGKITSGEIIFRGEDLLKKSKAKMREIRGKTISMIFQDPMTSLNPVFTVGDQIISVIRAHQSFSKTDAIARAIEMFTQVGLPDARALIRKYPHELSGGQRQRIMIAMALACKPSLLIADEPTTALDVTIQAQILDLMRRLKEKKQASIILITHDLGVVAKMCDKIAVMYAGHIVEYGNPKHLFKNPQHPYTHGLLASTPMMGGQKERLNTIEGNVPDLSNPPSGCRFNPRCTEVQEACFNFIPPMVEVEKGHFVSCHTY
jgi:oligopeptide/dipeptide ABC transporter ATP-binding protein